MSDDDSDSARTIICRVPQHVETVLCNTGASSLSQTDARTAFHFYHTATALMDKLHFPLRIALTDFITFVFVSYYCIFVYLAAILQSVGSFCVVFATDKNGSCICCLYFCVCVML